MIFVGFYIIILLFLSGNILGTDFLSSEPEHTILS